MGINTSKSTGGTAVDAKRNEREPVPVNPDPRSPSPEIVRTPIQDKTDAIHNITKIVDLSKTFEEASVDEKIVNNNPILAAVIKNHLQSYDPRSPTQDFERTPIIIASKIIDNKIILQQQLIENISTPCNGTDLLNDEISKEKNTCPEHVLPKNLCNGFFDMTLDDSVKDSEGPLNSSIISEEMTESNIEDNCNVKPTILLETNFDYVEDTDRFNQLQDSEKIEYVTEATPICELELLKNDPRSPSEGIERTPIIVGKTELNDIDQNVEEMSDETLIKVLQNTNIEYRQTLSKSQKNQDSLLIYEDESDNVNETPRKPKSVSNSGLRTPLSCMKNKTGSSQNRSKSDNTIFHSDDRHPQSRIPKRVSHIPRLKSLSKLRVKGSSISMKSPSNTMGVSGDCENTPPQSHRDRWDKEKSIVL